MIIVKNLSYTYPKAKEPVLKDLNFEIGQGEILGFFGPSGAGRSTTQKVLYKYFTITPAKFRLKTNL
jgi:fluoroquinolone transport system ATP-binding protein